MCKYKTTDTSDDYWNEFKKFDQIYDAIEPGYKTKSTQSLEDNQESNSKHIRSHKEVQVKKIQIETFYKYNIKEKY